MINSVKLQIPMPKAEGKANVTAVIPVELKEKLKKYADTRKWSLSTAMVTLIEEGLEREANEVNGNPVQPQPTASEDIPTRRAKRMSGTGFMALAISKQVQENYYELLSSGKIEHERLKALASGDKPTKEECQIIKETVTSNEAR